MGKFTIDCQGPGGGKYGSERVIKSSGIRVAMVAQLCNYSRVYYIVHF